MAALNAPSEPPPNFYSWKFTQTEWKTVETLLVHVMCVDQCRRIRRHVFFLLTLSVLRKQKNTERSGIFSWKPPPTPLTLPHRPRHQPTHTRTHTHTHTHTHTRFKRTPWASMWCFNMLPVPCMFRFGLFTTIRPGRLCNAPAECLTWCRRFEPPQSCRLPRRQVWYPSLYTRMPSDACRDLRKAKSRTHATRKDLGTALTATAKMNKEWEVTRRAPLFSM